jgi:hypothetical protein
MDVGNLAWFSSERVLISAGKMPRSDSDLELKVDFESHDLYCAVLVGFMIEIHWVGDLCFYQSLTCAVETATSYFITAGSISSYCTSISEYADELLLPQKQILRSIADNLPNNYCIED